MKCTIVLIGALFVSAPAFAGQDDKSSASKCTCSSVPFRPNPPCVSVCAGALIANVPLERLQKSLDLQEATWNEIEYIKRPPTTGTSGVGSSRSTALDSFLASPEGKAFLKELEDLPQSEFGALMREAQKKSSQ